MLYELELHEGMIAEEQDAEVLAEDYAEANGLVVEGGAHEEDGMTIFPAAMETEMFIRRVWICVSGHNVWMES